MSAELLIDVMEMVAERLRGNTQLASNGRRAAAIGEKLEDAEFLPRERTNCRVRGRDTRERDEFAGGIDHSVQQLLVAPVLVDIARQTREQPAPVRGFSNTIVETFTQMRPSERVRTSRSKFGIPPERVSSRLVAKSEPLASARVPNASCASSTPAMFRPTTSFAE
jgi:hypothetical protein